MLQITTKIKQCIFTDKKQDGSPLLRKDTPYNMLHIQTESLIWISRFYNHNDESPAALFTYEDTYVITYKQVGPYNNIIAIRLDDSDEYQKALKTYRQDNAMSVNDPLTEEDRISLELILSII